MIGADEAISLMSSCTTSLTDYKGRAGVGQARVARRCACAGAGAPVTDASVRRVELYVMGRRHHREVRRRRGASKLKRPRLDLELLDRRPVQLAQQSHHPRLFAGTRRAIKEHVREVARSDHALHVSGERLVIVEAIERFRAVLVNPQHQSEATTDTRASAALARSEGGQRRTRKRSYLIPIYRVQVIYRSFI